MSDFDEKKNEQDVPVEVINEMIDEQFADRVAERLDQLREAEESGGLDPYMDPNSFEGMPDRAVHDAFKHTATIMLDGIDNRRRT